VTAEVQAVETVPEVPAAPSVQTAEPKAAEPEAPASQSTTTEATTQSTTTQAAQAPATTTQTAAAPATQAAPASGNFAVQLVSLKNRGAAEAEWRRLQGVFPNLLGGKSLLLQSADVAGVGTVYRLRAGPFASKAKAAQVCAQLKSKQQDCLVVSR
jgi:cell division septation protein DedD